MIDRIRVNAAPSAWAIVPSALLLIWPAFWNGYPLVFSDTGTYLGQALLGYLGWDRPPFYSLFLHALHLRISLWPVVIVQGLMLAHLLQVVLRVLGRPGTTSLLITSAGLATVTGLPFFAAQIMPDMFTGVAILTLWLLGFRHRDLSPVERVYFMLLAIGAIVVHQSHIPLASGLALLSFPLHWANTGLRTAAAAAARMAIPPLLAMLALTTTNLAAHKRLSPSPFGAVFLAARLIYDGPGAAYLDRHCPEMGFHICPVRDHLGSSHNVFLWTLDGPLYTVLGGPKSWAPEAAAIVRGTLAEDSGGVLGVALRNALEQFSLIATGDGLGPWPSTPGPEPLLAHFFAAEHETFLNARQQLGMLEGDAQYLSPMHRAAATAGLVVLLGLMIFRRRRGSGGTLAVLVTAAALGNAAIAGSLSGPTDRYQARIAWLFPFVAASVLAVPRRHDQGVLQGRGQDTMANQPAAP